MGDEQHGHPGLALETVDEGEDLGLDRDVEGRGGFVGDQQARAAGHRHGDHDALPHPAGEFVRILVQAALGFRDADFAEQLEGARASGGGGQAAMRLEPVGQLPPDREDRIQRGHRLLEYHADLVAADFAHGGRVGGSEVDRLPVGTVEVHGTGRDAAAAEIDEAHDRQRGDGFAGAGLADHAERLAGLNGEADVAHAGNPAAIGIELDA